MEEKRDDKVLDTMPVRLKMSYRATMFRLVEIIDQFKKWGVKSHQLKFEKPRYDLFICDKAINSIDYFLSEE